MTDTDKIYVVGEDYLDGKTRIYRAFDNEDAAVSYVDDPDNLGHLFIEELTLEAEYDQ